MNKLSLKLFFLSFVLLSTAWAEELPVDPVAKVVTTETPQATEVACEKKLTVAEELIAKSLLVRSPEKIDEEAQALANRMMIIAKDPNVSSISLRVASLLDPEYESFRQASEFFLLTSDDQTAKDFSKDLTLLIAHQGKLGANVRAMQIILDPKIAGFWEKRRLKKSGKLDKNAVALDIQICRQNMLKCLTTSNRNLARRESDLKNIEQVLARANEHILILGSIVRKIQQLADLNDTAKVEILGILKSQIEAFSQISIIISATRQNITSELIAGRNIIEAAHNLTHLEIQRLAVIGAPPSILRISTDNNSEKLVRAEFRHIFSQGLDNTSIVDLIKKEIESAKSISDAELLFILKSIPKSVAWGTKGGMIFSELHTEIANSGGTAWGSDNQYWLGMDIQIVLKALKKTKTRTLSNEDLSELARLVKDIVKASKTFTEHVYVDNYIIQVNICFDKLVMDVIKLGEE